MTASENLNQISLDNYNKNDLPGFKTALVFIVFSALISLPAGWISGIIKNILPEYKEWGFLLSYILSFGFAFFIAQKMFAVKKLQWKISKAVVFILALPLTLLFIPINDFLSGLIPMPQIIKDYFEKMIQINLPGYLVVGIAAPIIEELIFRGIVLKALLRKYNPTKAIIYSALAFGIMHLNPWQFIPATIIGCLIGWFYYHTKSIVPGILIHWINNTAAFLLAIKYTDVNIRMKDIVGGWQNYTILLLSCIVLIYLLIRYTKYYFKKEESMQKNSA